MANRKRSRGTAPGADYDSPWKEALDHYFEPCMVFFFPVAHADIDWTRGHEMLDKELQPIVRQAKHGRRYGDKLVKVWLKTGEEKWLLIHVEVQGSKEADFPVRMHVYNHRIFDRYDREVISLAILADEDPGWRPNRYETARWGFRSLTEFPVVKLIDHAPTERHAWKVRLVKGLYGRGMESEDVRRLFRFIDWIMELPKPLEDRFWDEIDAFQQEKAMRFISIAERMTMVKGLLRGIEVALDLKFGAEGLELMPELRQIRDDALLEKVLARLKTAASPEDLRRIWTRKRRPKAAKPE
jgi:hypothetical protein